MDRPHDQPSVEAKLQALMDRERRRLLFGLLQVPAEAGGAGGDDRIVVDGGERSVFMHHDHLPKLDAIGFIEYDRAAGRVTRGPEFDSNDSLLRLLADTREDFPGDW